MAIGVKYERTGEISYFYRYSWIQMIRPMTLTGSIGPAIAGTLLSAQEGSLKLDVAIIYLFAAILVQATINMWNDYFDFKNGQDQEKWERMKGLKVWHKPRHQIIPIVTAIMIGASAILGLFLAITSSYWVLIVGAIGIFFGFFYSAGKNSLASRGLGELVAGFFLGPVVTVLAYIVQGNQLDIKIVLISLPFSFLIASMILSNNIRDMEKDKGFRRTQAINLGRKKASTLLSILIFLPYLIVTALVITELVSTVSLVVMLAFPIALGLRKSYRYHALRIEEISGMKLAAMHHWLFGQLFAWSLLVI